MSKTYTMQARGAIRVAEPGKTTTAKQQRAIEAFETSLFTRDREAVLNRKLFALRAAEFLCEIIRTGAATAEAIAKAEPERFEEILKQLPKDSEARPVLQPARKVSAAASKAAGLVVHPVGTRVFRDNRKGTTSTNEETMIEASLIGDDGRKLSESRTPFLMSCTGTTARPGKLWIPEDGGTWLQEAIGRETNNDAAMVTAATALSETLVGIAEHRNFELLLKAGWTKESGGVLYGGLQLNDSPQLLSSFHHFLTQTPGAPPNVGEIVALTEVDGVQMIRIQLPADGVESIRTESGMTISHIWLAHQNSCLWFAAGTENSKEIIRQSLARCTEGSLAARTPLVSLRVDMERWLSYPQDDPVGIARLPHYLDENA